MSCSITEAPRKRQKVSHLESEGIRSNEERVNKAIKPVMQEQLLALKKQRTDSPSSISLVSVTPETLEKAVKENNTSLIKTLLQCKKYRNDLLYIASKLGKIKVVELLLKAGADKEVRAGDTGLGPLHCAAFGGHKAVVELLLKKGADKETRSVIGWKMTDKEAGSVTGMTPLHYAAAKGRKEVVGLLLKVGADKEARTVDGMTPLHLAAGRGCKEVVELLLRAGANKEARRVNGMTPLHLAAGKGRKEVVELLLKAGVDKELSDAGWAPLHLAANNGHEDVVEYLLINRDNFLVNISELTKYPEVIKVLLGEHRNKDYTHDEYISLIKRSAENSSKEQFIKIARMLVARGVYFSKELVVELKIIASKAGNNGILLYLETSDLINFEAGYENLLYNTAASGTRGQYEELKQLWSFYAQKLMIRKMLTFRTAEHLSSYLAAAKSGNISFLHLYYQGIIKKGVFNITSVDQEKQLNNTALVLAFINKKFEAMSWLMDKGADPLHLSRSISRLSELDDDQLGAFNGVMAKRKETMARTITEAIDLFNSTLAIQPV